VSTFHSYGTDKKISHLLTILRWIRFSVSLFENFFAASEGNTSSTPSLAGSVAISRSACKLRYLVGCAPVCYGVPMHLLHR
jgi:hypothetical protein